MKTNFLKTVKQAMFLLLALGGTIAGYSQQTQNPPLNIGGRGGTDTDTGQYDIGGGKSTDGGGLLVTIGGSSTGPKGTTSDTGQITDIGGKGSSDTGSGQYDIGGRGGSDTGTDPFDIGGKSTPGDIGVGGLIGLGTSMTGESIFDIGGGKSSDGGLGDIGGRDSGGGLIINPLAANDDIGGTTTGGGKGTSADTGQIAFLEFECAFTSFSNDMQGCIKNPSLETPLFQF